MANVKPIHDKVAYGAALARIDQLMNAAAGTPEGEELDILTTLVGAFEEATMPVDFPDAQTAVEFVMEQKGYARQDLAELLGRSRASEFMTRKRNLSMNQAKALNKNWGVPADALLA